MTQAVAKPFKSLDLDELGIEEFQPKATKIVDPDTQVPLDKRPTPRGKIEKKAVTPVTVFPSREPTQPKYQQLNMHIRSDVAERFKSLAIRDQYTTWKYGQIIEFLLDQYEKTLPKS